MRKGRVVLLIKQYHGRDASVSRKKETFPSTVYLPDSSSPFYFARRESLPFFADYDKRVKIRPEL